MLSPVPQATGMSTRSPVQLAASLLSVPAASSGCRTRGSIDGFSPTTSWLTGGWDAERERLAFRSVPASREDELRWEYRFEADGVFVKELLGPDGSGGFVLRSDYRYVPVEDSTAER